MQDFKNLRECQKAHRLAINAYALSEYLQEPRAWALRDQSLKAVISIPSNIAEGPFHPARERTIRRAQDADTPDTNRRSARHDAPAPVAGPGTARTTTLNPEPEPGSRQPAAGSR